MFILADRESHKCCRFHQNGLQWKGERMQIAHNEQCKKEGYFWRVISHASGYLHTASQTYSYKAYLATERERHLTTGKPAEKTKLDFRCPICCSDIGQASCFICPRSRQLTFSFCCLQYNESFYSLWTGLWSSGELLFFSPESLFTG